MLETYNGRFLCACKFPFSVWNQPEWSAFQRLRLDAVFFLRVESIANETDRKERVTNLAQVELVRELSWKMEPKIVISHTRQNFLVASWMFLVVDLAEVLRW